MSKFHILRCLPVISKRVDDMLLIVLDLSQYFSVFGVNIAGKCEQNSCILQTKSVCDQAARRNGNF